MLLPELMTGETSGLDISRVLVSCSVSDVDCESGCGWNNVAEEVLSLLTLLFMLLTSGLEPMLGPIPESW